VKTEEGDTECDQEGKELGEGREDLVAVEVGAAERVAVNVGGFTDMKMSPE
jgi:hypothetical protein